MRRRVGSKRLHFFFQDIALSLLILRSNNKAKYIYIVTLDYIFGPSCHNLTEALMLISGYNHILTLEKNTREG
jgi:hypothetical protein